MILVADASALIALATCDSLVLLDAIFGNVLVPDAVYAEVTESDKPQSNRLRSYLQGKVRVVDMQHFVYLDAFADLGETQAMLLYKSIGCIKLPKFTKTFEEQVTDFDKCCFVLVYRSSVSQDGVAINISTLKPFR